MTTLMEARRRAQLDATRSRMHLCPDPQLLEDLLEGLVENEERYGYPSCPCRLATGNLEEDRDIICPCYYRDQDVEEYGQCYCGLFVSEEVASGRKQLGPIPERRGQTEAPTTTTHKGLPQTLWVCQQCGYLALRDQPPYRCPICGAKRELFAQVALEAAFKTLGGG